MAKNQSADFGTEKRYDDAGIPMANGDEADINPTLLRREGFASEGEYRAYLATLGADVLSASEDYVEVPFPVSEDHVLEARLRELREELENLRARLHVIREQAATVVAENVRWADASAHAQLGNQPWLKLAGAMAATFVVARGIRRLPLGTVATTALPLVAAVMNRKLARA